jgi:hypothetical protein
VSLLSTLEAGPRFTVILSSPPTTVRQFDSNLIPHEEAFMVFGNALLSGFPAFKFYETITESVNEG